MGGATADLLHQDDQARHLYHYHPLHIEMQVIDMVVAMVDIEKIGMIGMEEEGDLHQEEEICTEIEEEE